MEALLIEFVGTLDASLKSLVKELGASAGFSRLTISQFQYLEAVHSLGEPTITEIAAHLNITKASVTAGINKLVQMGYLQKNQSLQDKRSYLVSLSDSGHQLVRAKYAAVQEYGQFIRSVLSAQEIEQFQAVLTKLVRLFKHA